MAHYCIYVLLNAKIGSSLSQSATHGLTRQPSALLLSHNPYNNTTMSDNKLRCALVFRLEGGSSTGGDGGEGGDVQLTNFSAGSATLLAKYDHASEYEAHAGSTGGLYGDKEKNYADAVGMVVGGDPPSGISETNMIGGFKVVQSDMHQVVYGSDSDGLCEYDEPY